MDSLSVEPAVLTQYTPLFGVIGSIPAIFFAFDGFYAPSGVYNDLKNKKVFPKALSWGILFTTIIYLLISLGLLFGAKNGTVIGLLDLNTDVGKIISFIVEFCIFVAVLCILNGFALYGGDFYESLVKNNEIPNAIKKRFNLQDRKVMSMVVVGFYIFVFVLATVIGMFYFHNLYDGVKYYDRFTKAIYQFCDIVSN
jgi:amino acid transporter